MWPAGAPRPAARILAQQNDGALAARRHYSTRPDLTQSRRDLPCHVFCTFLALVQKRALEDRIAALARSGSWPQIIADLDSLTETEIEHEGKQFVVRSAPRPAASLALRAAGVALPPTVRPAAVAARIAIADQLLSKISCSLMVGWNWRTTACLCAMWAAACGTHAEKHGDSRVGAESRSELSPGFQPTPFDI
jgi:hypothetical protein